jgi:F0F1-type ATP synthase membrane subunit b/b'
MNRKLVVLSVISMVSVLASFAPSAKADDIDEKQQKLQARINQAAQSKQLSRNDNSELKKEMADFSEAKRAIRNAHSDVLSAEDDDKLDKQLNEINQHFEQKRKPLPDTTATPAKSKKSK